MITGTNKKNRSSRKENAGTIPWLSKLSFIYRFHKRKRLLQRYLMNELLCMPKADTNVKAGIIILAVKVILSYTTIGTYIPYLDDILSLAAVFFLAISIIQKQYSIRTMLLYASIAFLGLITSRYVGNVMLFITILTILAIRREKGVVYFLLKYESLTAIIIACCSLLTGTHLSYDSELQKYLFDFGFSHPNLISCIIFNIVIMWLWVYYDSLDRRAYMFCLLFLYAVFLLTGSRTMLFLGVFTIILISISKSNKRIVHTSIKAIAKYIVPILAIFFYYTCIYYNESNQLITQINDFLTNRIKLGAYAYTQYGFSFLGQVVEKNTEFGYDAVWNMSKFIAFDNLYTSLMINYGFIWLIVIASSLYFLANKGNTLVNCMIIIWAIYGITETHGINGFLCFPILFISFILEKNLNHKYIQNF